MKYEELLEEAENNGVSVDERYPFKSSKLKGLYYNNNIALSKNIQTNAERATIIAEELGHHYTAVGNILDQSSVANRKVERLGRIYAYNRLVGILGIIKAYEYGCQNRYEISMYLDVTEDFLDESLKFYRQKYGCKVAVDNYVVFFEPYLAVMKII